MIETADQSKPALVFVYNADSGLFNALSDMSHKLFSPETYQCRLCALTYSTFGMRKSWKQFLATLDHAVEFLHADELKQLHGVSAVRLPAIFIKEGGDLKVWVDAREIEACRTIDDLKQLVSERLQLERA